MVKIKISNLKELVVLGIPIAGWYHLPDSNSHVCINERGDVIAKMKPKL